MLQDMQMKRAFVKGVNSYLGMQIGRKRVQEQYKNVK